MSIGFAKLHRKILDWEWYNDINVSRLFIHLVLKANYEDKKWRGSIIKRGELITSLDKLSSETNLSMQQLRTAINKLISSKEITRKATNQFTHITLCNYSIYQDKNDVDNKPATNEQQTNNKPITTTKEDKKIRNKESNPPTPLVEDSGGRCLRAFYEIENQNDFKEKCLSIAKAKRFTETDAENIFTDFENYWLSPALPPSKANKKNWQRAFQNWIAKSSPANKTNNEEIANNILNRAIARFEESNLLDVESPQIQSNLIFLKILKKGYSENNIINVLRQVYENPPPQKIYSWALINQYF